MKNIFTIAFNTEVIFGICIACIFFAITAIPAHATTDAERFSRMESQLDQASAMLVQIVHSISKQAVLGASTNSEELQAQINTLMVQIAKLDQVKEKASIAALRTQITALMAQIGANQGSTVSVIKPIGLPKTPFFTIVQETKEITRGAQDVVIARIKLPVVKTEIAKVKEDRYLNSILVRVVPGQKNGNIEPWESFDEMSIYVSGYKVKAVDVRDPNKWKVTTNEKGRKIYEFALYNGNQKLPVGGKKEITALLAVTSSNNADKKDVWTMWVPKNGVTVWTPSQKHVKYGPTEQLKYVMVGGEDQEVGPVVEVGDTQVNLENPDTDPSGDYDIDFEVTANNTDVYIPTSAVRFGVPPTGSTVGVVYRIVGADGKVVKKGTASAALDSIADEDLNYYVISEGESETLGANIWFKPSKAGSYRVELVSVNWTDHASGKLTQVKFNPADGFKTDYLTIPTLE